MVNINLRKLNFAYAMLSTFLNLKKNKIQCCSGTFWKCSFKNLQISGCRLNWISNVFNKNIKERHLSVICPHRQPLLAENAAKGSLKWSQTQKQFWADEAQYWLKLLVHCGSGKQPINLDWRYSSRKGTVENIFNVKRTENIALFANISISDMIFHEI